MSSLLLGAELLKCSASLYWNLEAPKENPREAKIHGQFILKTSMDQKNSREHYWKTMMRTTFNDCLLVT